MKKIIIAFIAVAVLALGAILVIAQKAERTGGSESHGRQGFGKRGHRGGGMMLRGLDLTEAQKAQVKDIMEASRAKVKPLRESMKANREKLRLATENGKFNEAQVQSLANEQSDLSAQILVERTRVKSQIFGLLTPEQKAKAAQMKDQMKERFKGKGRHFRNRDKSGEKSTETPKE